MTRHSRRRRPRRRLLLWLLAVLLGGAFLYWSNTALQMTETDVAFASLPAGFDGFRAVVLGDLHTDVFGQGNGRLLKAVAAAEPEAIFFTGDLLDSLEDVPPDYAAETAAALSAIAPLYYVTGNHEWAVGNVRELKKTLASHGALVLSNDHMVLERNGDHLVLAGIDDPNGFADQKTPETLAAEVYAAYGDVFWLLLAHRNDHFERQYSLLGADLVISGHGHGGIVRLPFTDGLLSTDRTFFFSYTAGLYEANGSALFVTRGLGNTGRTFRLFNRPEVAVLTLRRG